jgi:hypothetical protein
MGDSKKKVISLSGARNKDKDKKEKKEASTAHSDNQELTYCSFCGRPNPMVIKMIKGPGVNICSECVMICVQYFIMEDRIPSAEAKKVLDTFWQGTKK